MTTPGLEKLDITNTKREQGVQTQTVGTFNKNTDLLHIRKLQWACAFYGKVAQDQSLSYDISLKNGNFSLSTP